MADSGLILGIEVSNPSASAGDAQGPGVALGRLVPGGVDILGMEPVRASGFGTKSAGSAGHGGHDDDLMPAIDRLVKRTGVPIRTELARVAVSAGPGGYTSLRVACAVGKMIAAGANHAGQPTMCVGVPTSLVVLESVPAEVRSDVVAIALASKAESAWIECFSNGASIGEGRLMSVSDWAVLQTLGVRTVVADRFFPQTLRARASHAGIRIIEPVFDAPACARVGARLPEVAPSGLVPIYPREPDAVTLWRTRARTP